MMHFANWGGGERCRGPECQLVDKFGFLVGDGGVGRARAETGTGRAIKAREGEEGRGQTSPNVPQTRGGVKPLFCLNMFHLRHADPRKLQKLGQEKSAVPGLFDHW